MGSSDSPHRYVEWSTKTNYSFLHAGSSPEEIAARAAEVGLTAIAVTDFHGVYGMPKLWGALRKLPNPPKLLIGAEIPLFTGEGPKKEFGPSVSLIARSRAGYGALCRILTDAHRFCEKGRSELSVPDFLSRMQFVSGAEDLLLFPQWEDYWEARWVSGLEDFFRIDPATIAERIASVASWMSEFPSDRMHIPLSRRVDGLDGERTAIADHLSKILGLKQVAHNRVLYHAPERRRVQDTLACIREGKTFQEAGYLLRRNEEAYLKSPATMAGLFRDRPELIERGVELAESCHFLPSELRYIYPSEWIPTGMTAQSYLVSLCEAGVTERYSEEMTEKVRAQLQHELKLIQELNYADYFLTVYDIVAFARSQKILCQGRGSAANSIVCYLLGITAIDPIQMGFLFERFISAERGEPPDIDVDFEHERREEVIQYVYRKYGRERAAMVSAVNTYRSRSALRETTKVFGVNIGTISAKKVEKMLSDPEQVSAELSDRIHAVADEMRDFPRHLSIHSGGFTLSAGPIIEIVPVEPATMEGRTIVQWDKYDLDILGLLKIDILSLGMLSALRRGLELVGKQLYEVKPTDPETYAMIQKADTIGTFQIESRAQMAMLPRLLPKNFYELVVEVAIVRPGPIVGKMVHPFLKRKRGEPYELDPRLEHILGRTYGVPIFQEQVMKIAIDLAGFTPGEADQLRRAIGAWRSSGSIDEMGKRLKDRLVAVGINEGFAQQIFDQIHGFAEYGFPESHAASFALLAYVSCWLKRHHPTEFLVAMLNSQPLGFYSSHTLVDDAVRHGVEVRPISILKSEWESKLEIDPDGKKAVRIGFHQVNGLGEGEWNAIRRARSEQVFQGYQDFFARVREKNGGVGIRRKALRSLAVGDVFRELGLNQREALWKTLESEVLREADLFTREKEGVQPELFSSTAMREMSRYESILSDYRALGMSTRGHPMACIRERLKGPRFGKLSEMTARRAKESPNGKTISIPGLSLVLQRPPTASGTAFATLEDETGFIDLIFHREVFLRVHGVMTEEPFVIVTGVLQRDGLAASLVVKEVKPFLPNEDPSLEGDTELVAKFEVDPTAIGQVKIPDSPGAIARAYF